MLKKVSILTICLLYLFTASGFALNIHYCLGAIRSVKIDGPAQKCSPKKMSMKCCKDKRLDVKVKDAHQGQGASALAKVFSFDLPWLHTSGHLFPVLQALLNRAPERGPPDTVQACQPPIWLKNRNLRT